MTTLRPLHRWLLPLMLCVPVLSLALLARSPLSVGDTCLSRQVQSDTALNLPVAATERTSLDRTIRKEPAYGAKPRYGLLVLGPNAETMVWLVVDGKTLYVDRNGNGDLTEDGERVQADDGPSTDILTFQAGAFVEANGKIRHSNLFVYQYFDQQRGRLVNSVLVSDVLGTAGQGNHAEEGCSFAESPKDAPVIHVNGPLTMRVHSAVVENRGTKSVRQAPVQLAAGERLVELHVQVGTPGLGVGTFAAVAVEKGFPTELHPTVRLAVPGKDDPKKTVELTFQLKARC